MKKQKYIYKNKKYIILHESKIKNQKTREWDDVIIYQQEESGLVFVRNTIEFYFKFDLIEEYE